MLSSSPVAWLNCAKMATGEDTVRNTKVEDPREGAFKHSLDGPFGWGHTGWLVGHWRPPFSQQVRTALEQQNDKKPTSATRAPEVGGEH